MRVKHSEEDFDDVDDVDSFDEDVSGSGSRDDDLFEEDLGFDDGFGSGISPMEKHSDLLKGLTDFEPFMKTIVSEWLGMVWSEADEKYIQDDDVEATMNLYGARWCVNFLRVYTRDNNIITDLDKVTYNNMMEEVVETVFLNIGCRAEQFGIKYDGDILKVGNQLCHSTALVLIGTGGGKNYKDLLMKSVSRTENVSVNESHNPYGMPMPVKKPGWLGGLGNMFGKT